MDDYSTAGHSERVALVEGWENFICNFADWKHFGTLTFREIQSSDQVWNQFRFLLQVLNRDLFGNHYTRIVGHNYFAYAVGLEMQKRGALHLHFLADRPINYNIIHAVWQKMSGWAWITPATDRDRAVAYLAKYITKGGDLSLYRPREVKQPAFVPYWFDPEKIDPARLFR